MNTLAEPPGRPLTLSFTHAPLSRAMPGNPPVERRVHSCSAVSVPFQGPVSLCAHVRIH